jgi:hypothetical protein
MTDPIPGLRYGLSLYLTSDKLAADTVVTLEAFKPLPPIVAEPDLKTLLAAVGGNGALEQLFKSAHDWRVMSDAEIAQYKERIND